VVAPPESEDPEALVEEVADTQAPAEPSLEQIVQARSRIRTQLEALRAKLSEQLNERDCYLALFPIVAHFDELVQIRCLKSDHRCWPPLQGELFNISDAGEVFYELLDDLMLKPQTLPFIYEVFYLCLNDGFVGRYAGNPAKLIEYQERLRNKIPLVEMKESRGAADGVSRLREYRSPGWYYAVVGAVLVAVCLSLFGLARIWNPLD
jgi:type IV/VI secretion system ImpK/VasF family protein